MRQNDDNMAGAHNSGCSISEIDQHKLLPRAVVYFTAV